MYNFRISLINLTNFRSIPKRLKFVRIIIRDSIYYEIYSIISLENFCAFTADVVNKRDILR